MTPKRRGESATTSTRRLIFLQSKPDPDRMAPPGPTHRSCWTGPTAPSSSTTTNTLLRVLCGLVVIVSLGWLHLCLVETTTTTTTSKYNTTTTAPHQSEDTKTEKTMKETTTNNQNIVNHSTTTSSSDILRLHVQDAQIQIVSDLHGKKKV